VKVKAFGPHKILFVWLKGKSYRGEKIEKEDEVELISDFPWLMLSLMSPSIALRHMATIRAIFSTSLS
jgi:hypothetical protein